MSAPDLPPLSDIPASSRRKRSRLQNKSTRREIRRWLIPPAILRNPDEILDGVAILDEHAPDFGLKLWLLFRDVVLWSETSEPRTIFWPDGSVDLRWNPTTLSGSRDDALTYWIRSLIDTLRHADEAAPVRVADLCVRISRWMLAHGHSETALSFAQAGALANPSDPVPALETARVAAGLKKLTRAETWLHRTVGLARRVKDWPTYASAYVELGRISEARGDVTQARNRYLTAKRTGRRTGLRQASGEAIHGLFRLALAESDLEAGSRLGAAAARWLPPEHPAQPALRHDLAEVWLRTGKPGRALPVLVRLLVDMTTPEQRMYTLALITSASVTSPGPLPQSWGEAWLLVTQYPDAPLRTRTLLELAETADRAGDRRRAAQARQALQPDDADAPFSSEPWRARMGAFAWEANR